MKKRIIYGLLILGMIFSCGCSKTDDEEEVILGDIQDVPENTIVIDDENFKDTINDIYNNPEEYDGKQVYCYGICNKINNHTYVYRTLSTNYYQEDDHMIEPEKIGIRYVFSQADATSYLGYFCLIEGKITATPLDARGKEYDCFIEVSHIVREYTGNSNIDQFQQESETETETQIETQGEESSDNIIVFDTGRDVSENDNDSGERPSSGISSDNETSEEDSSDNETSEEDSSDNETSGEDSSDNETSGEDSSDNETSGGDSSDNETSGGDSSDNETSGGDSSD